MQIITGADKESHEVEQLSNEQVSASEALLQADIAAGFNEALSETLGEDVKPIEKIAEPEKLVKAAKPEKSVEL